MAKVAVSVELEPELLAKLDEKRVERSRAAEVRMAIRAWVDGNPARREPVETGKAAAA